MKAVVAAFNQEKALVGAFSVIVQLHRLIDSRHYPGQTLVCGATELSIIAVQGRTFLSSWVKYGTHNIHTRQDTGHQPSLTPHTDPEYSEYTGYLGRTPLVEIVHQIQNINDTSTFAYNCTPGHITTGHHL